MAIEYSTWWQAFCQPLYSSQTCNLQAEFVYILSAQSRETNSACRFQVWQKYEDEQNQTFISASFLCSTWSVSCYELYKSLQYKPQIKPPLVNFQIFLPTNLRCRGISLPNNLVSIKWLCSIKVDCLSQFLYHNSVCHKFLKSSYNGWVTAVKVV